MQQADANRMILNKRDAASIGAGAWLGFYFFASDLSHCIPGGIVMSVFLLSLSTPQALDIQNQVCTFNVKHASVVNRGIHLASVWPVYLAGLVLVQSYSRQWAVLLSIFYVSFYILSEPSLIGLAAAILTVACYEIAELLIRVNANARQWALVTAIACIVLQMLGSFVSGTRAKQSQRRQMQDVFVETVLLAPMILVFQVLHRFGYEHDGYAMRELHHGCGDCIFEE